MNEEGELLFVKFLRQEVMVKFCPLYHNALKLYDFINLGSNAQIKSHSSLCIIQYGH